MNNKLAFAICEFLEESIKNKTISADNQESIQVAIQCISEAFEIDFPNDSTLSVKPAALSQIFKVFTDSQSKVKKDGGKKEAEEFKNKGNAALSSNDLQEAIRCYSEAIKLDGTNAIYYGNRAAVYGRLADHEKAIQDANEAIRLDPKYSKGFSRLGNALFAQKKYNEAVEAFEKGLKLDPDNKIMTDSLNTAKEKSAVSQSTNESEARSLGGGAAAGGGGAGPDFSSLLNNPQIMQMAGQMMQNPQFAQMAQQFLGADGSPDLSSMMNNPQLANLARNFMGNGENPPQ